MVYHRILTALDFSPGSNIVFEQALDIAQQNQASLMLFHCISSESYLPYGSLVGDSWGNLSSLLRENLEQEKTRTIKKLSDYGQKAQIKGLAVEWDWKVGDAGGWIKKMSEIWQADLIVLGRKKLKDFPEVLIGSTSNYVVQHASCSVLIVQLKQL
jgi:nucleotide-binding universal stress UspA family protein